MVHKTRPRVPTRARTTNSCALRTTPSLPIAKTSPRFREIETVLALHLSRKQGVRRREEGAKREGEEEERKGGNGLGSPSRNTTWYCESMDEKFTIKRKKRRKKKKNERGRGGKISVAVFKRTRQGLREQSIHYYIYIIYIVYILLLIN